MDHTDLPEEPAPPRKRPQTDDRNAAPSAAFIDHIRYGHGILNVPKDEAEAWRLHQRLHGR